jgi:hypothetical protein
MERQAQGRCDSGVSLACATGDHMTRSARPGKPDCCGLCRTGNRERGCLSAIALLLPSTFPLRTHHMLARPFVDEALAGLGAGGALAKDWT